jgi:hypothetical protein
MTHQVRQSQSLYTQLLVHSKWEFLKTLTAWLLPYEGPSWPPLYGSTCTMQSVPIATNVVSSNPAQARCTRYNIM